MARKFTLLCLVSIFFATAVHADEPVLQTLRDFKAGDWCLSFAPYSGINLSYKGVNLIRTSTMIAHNGQYTSAYLSYSVGKNIITTREISGGKEVTIQHLSDPFKGTQTITFLANKAIFRYDFATAPNITDGKMDYCFGYLSTQPFAGRAYSLKGPEGEKSGILPLKNYIVDENYAPNYYREAHFDSTLGPLEIKVDGDLEGLMLLEFRGSPNPNARKGPTLWSGIFQRPLEPGRKYSQSVTITIDPTPAASKTTRVSTGNMAMVQPVHQVQTTPGGELRIIPEPKEVLANEGYFNLNPETKIVVADDAREKDFSGALQLSSEVFALYQLNLKIVRESQIDTDQNVILVGEPSRHKKLVAFLNRENKTPPQKEEGYFLQVTPDRILVAGNDSAGSFYGMQSLRQIILPGSQMPRIHACEVNDWPSLKFRGIILFTGNRALPFHKKLIDRILTKYKYNALFLECTDAFWKSTPKTAQPFAMSQEDLRKEVAYARRNFLEVIPEISTPGHMSWLFRNQQNLSVAEDPKAPYAYCFSKKESYDLIFSIFNEAIDVFDHPKYFHIGHDEIDNFGKFPTCPLCSKKSFAQLLIEDTNKMRDFFAEKGIRVMMWGDMLLGPGEAVSGRNAPSVEEAQKRRVGLARDIIIEDWHYYPAPFDGYPSLHIFKDLGFDTISATWFEPLNIINLTEASRREKIMGHTYTIWAGYNSNEDNLINEKYQFTPIVMAGDYAWNSGKTSFEDLPYKTEDIFDQSFYQKLPVLVNRDGFTVDLSPLYNVKLADNPRGSGWVGLGPEFDLANAPTGVKAMRGIQFQLAKSTSEPSAIRVASSSDLDAIYPEKVSIPLNTKANSLIFLHTTARNDDLDRTIATYQICYTDGTKVEIPVVFGKNIGPWNDPRICPQADICWAGDNKAGERVVLREMEWRNPNPDKIIASIEVVSNMTEAGLALLGVTGTQN